MPNIAKRWELLRAMSMNLLRWTLSIPRSYLLLAICSRGIKRADKNTSSFFFSKFHLNVNHIRWGWGIFTFLAYVSFTSVYVVSRASMSASIVSWGGMAKKNKAVQEYSSAILQVFERLQTKPLPAVACTMKHDSVVGWTSRKKDICCEIQCQKLK